MKSLIIAILATLALQVGIVVVGSENAHADSHPRAVWMNRTCANEDSANCYWDATAGNGRGHSFYTHKIGKITCVMYANEAYATHHDYCY